MYICIESYFNNQLKLNKMEILTYLKANRNSIINTIQELILTEGIEISVKDVMIKVVEYSNLGCYDIVNCDEDLTQVIEDSVNEAKQDSFNNIIKKGQESEKYSVKIREQILTNFNK